MIDIVLKDEQYKTMGVVKRADNDTSLVICKKGEKVYAIPIEIIANTRKRIAHNIKIEDLTKFLNYANIDNLGDTNEYYRHFKNKIYTLLMCAVDYITDEILVIYRAKYGDNSVWARNYTDFNADISNRKDNITGQSRRFIKII